VSGRGLLVGAVGGASRTWAGTSPAFRTALVQEALTLVTVDGTVQTRCAIGDAAQPVLLHQGEIEFLIALGNSLATDGWAVEEGVTETRTPFILLRGLFIETENASRGHFQGWCRGGRTALGYITCFLKGSPFPQGTSMGRCPWWHLRPLNPLPHTHLSVSAPFWCCCSP
jgi:hypothetical protein